MFGSFDDVMLEQLSKGSVKETQLDPDPSVPTRPWRPGKIYGFSSVSTISYFAFLLLKFSPCPPSFL